MGGCYTDVQEEAYKKANNNAYGGGGTLDFAELRSRSCA